MSLEGFRYKVDRPNSFSDPKFYKGSLSGSSCSANAKAVAERGHWALPARVNNLLTSLTNLSRVRKEPSLKQKRGPGCAPRLTMYGRMDVIGQSWRPVFPRVMVTPSQIGFVLEALMVINSFVGLHVCPLLCLLYKVAMMGRRRLL